MLIGVEFVRALKPTAQREVQAACAAMRPAGQNPQLGQLPRAAPVFTAQSQDGTMIHLRELRGKVVLINFWASWCEVCKLEKPSLYELSKTYRDQLEVVTLASDRDWSAVKNAWEKTVAEASYLPGAAVLWRRAMRQELSWLPRDYVARYQTTMANNPKSVMLPPGEIAEFWRELRLATSLLPVYPPFQILLDPPAHENDNLGRVARSYGIKAVPESFLVDKEGMIRYYFINRRDWQSTVVDTCIRSLLGQ